MRPLTQILTLAVALCALVAGAAQAAGPFVLTSSSIKDGATMARKHAGAIVSNANCVGENISPALSWSGAPEEAKSLALLVVDPEGARGLGVNHFVAYGISPAVTGFSEGEISKPSPNYIGGKSSQGLAFYSGPCPPPGPAHHYIFVLIATDLAADALPAGLTRDELMAKLQGHAKGAAGLVAVFQHPS